jgi:hypothetical protein
VRERWILLLGLLVLVVGTGAAVAGADPVQAGALAGCGLLLGLADIAFWCWQEVRPAGLVVAAGTRLPRPAWGWPALVMAVLAGGTAAAAGLPSLGAVAGLLALAAAAALLRRPAGNGPARSEVVAARAVVRRLAGHGAPASAEVTRVSRSAAQVVVRSADGAAAGAVLADVAQAETVAALVGVPVSTPAL